MDKYAEALNSISSYEIWHAPTYEDGYHNFDDYTEYPFSDSEDIKILSELITKYDTLNKGINELLIKYENEIGSYKHNQLYSASDSGQQYASEQFYQREIYSDILQDLKKLKGE